MLRKKKQKEKAREKQKQEFDNRREEAQSKFTVPDWVKDVELELPSTEYENTEWGVSKKQTTRTINARDYYLEMLKSNWQSVDNPKVIKDIERYTKEAISKYATPQATKQPTTNETIPTKQTIEEDTNISKVEDKSTEIELTNAINPIKDKFNNETKPIEILTPTDRFDKQKIDTIAKNEYVNLDRNNIERANAFDKFVNHWYTLGIQQ